MENMDEVLENTIKIMKVLDYSGLNFHSIQVIQINFGTRDLSPRPMQINFGTRDLSPRPMSPCPKSPAAEMVAGDFFCLFAGTLAGVSRAAYFAGKIFDNIRQDFSKKGRKIPEF
ncbi:hypothetical protein KIAC18_002152 [Sporomusa sphaeroides]|uniref:hypothetical protein n=1 Tax=Sporomusa sphaeroides TaxID=47679 RepID=UPI003DA0CD1D